MSRHPLLITSLEDDFKKIGLISEDTNLSDEVEVIDEDELGEAAGRRVRGKRTKKMSAKARKKRKMWSRTAGGKAAKRKAKMRSRKPKAKRMRAKAKKKYGRFYQKSDVDDQGLSSLIGEVADLVNAIEGEEGGVEANEAIKSWANMAIISEMLGDFFGTIAEDEDDAELLAAFTEAAETFSGLAESAADHARGLKDGQLDEEDEDLQEVFSEHMQTLLSGLELYSDIVEEDEDEDDEDEDPTED